MLSSTHGSFFTQQKGERRCRNTKAEVSSIENEADI